MFETGKVRFSQFAALNDPFEFLVDVDESAVGSAITPILQKTWADLTQPKLIEGKVFSRVMEVLRSDQASAKRYDALPAEQRNAIEQRARRMIAAEAPGNIAKAEAVVRELERSVPRMLADRLRNEPASSVLIFSCAENANSVPMWAHYAANHTGFQIGFSPTDMFNLRLPLGDPILPRQVRYDDHTPIAGRFEDSWVDFVSQKMSDWSYEREWRFVWVDRSEQTDPNKVHLFDFNVRAIREITLGLSATQETEKAIRSALENRRRACPLYRVRRGKCYGFERQELPSDALNF